MRLFPARHNVVLLALVALVVLPANAQATDVAKRKRLDCVGIEEANRDRLHEELRSLPGKAGEGSLLPLVENTIKKHNPENDILIRVQILKALQADPRLENASRQLRLSPDEFEAWQIRKQLCQEQKADFQSTVAIRAGTAAVAVGAIASVVAVKRRASKMVETCPLRGLGGLKPPVTPPKEPGNEPANEPSEPPE